MIIRFTKTSLFFAIMLLLLLAAGCRQPFDSRANPSTDNEAPAANEATANQLVVLQRQVELLEKALAARAPKEAAETWAKGVKLRNGALQFAVFSPELKEHERSKYEKAGWTTGTSSPWVTESKITGEKQLANEQWEYEVTFEKATSIGKSKEEATKVTVKRHGDFWYITAIIP